MLQDKYLPRYHFTEKHKIVIARPACQVYGFVDQLDFSESIVIRTLFALRGMPARMMNRKGLEKERFTELERIKNEEIIVGLIGQFWKPSGNLQVFQPAEFRTFKKAGFAKASWNFKLIPESAASTILETETRIYCTDHKTKRKFSMYWFIVKPFSGLIRKEVLRLIKRKAERLPL